MLEPAPALPSAGTAQAGDDVGDRAGAFDVAVGRLPAAVPAGEGVKVTLFEQAGRRVVLTDAGARLARRAEEMLGLMETAEARARQRPGEAGGVLRVASFQTPLIALAPVAVSVLEQRHPDLRIEIAQREVEEAYEGLLAHRFEVILGEDYPGGPAGRPSRHRPGGPPAGPAAAGAARPRPRLRGATPAGPRRDALGARPGGHPHRGVGSAPTSARRGSSRGSASTPPIRSCRCTWSAPAMPRLSCPV